MYTYFEKTNSPEVYYYTCNFYNPDWIAGSMVILDDKKTLKYSYFVSDVYMKQTYNSDYEEGLIIHWAFIWNKKFPFK